MPKTGNRGPGVDLSVTSGGGIIVDHEYGYDGAGFLSNADHLNHEYGYDGIMSNADGVAKAQAACTRAGGTFSNRSGGAHCTFPMPVPGRPLLMRFANAQAAEAACSTAGGSFSNRSSRLACANPRRPVLGGPSR